MSKPYDDVPQLEPDETIPPRPEEEIADVARSEPSTGSVPVVPEPTSGAGDR